MYHSIQKKYILLTAKIYMYMYMQSGCGMYEIFLFHQAVHSVNYPFFNLKHLLYCKSVEGHVVKSLLNDKVIA